MARLLGTLDLIPRSDGTDFVLDCLGTVRRHLRMEVAYLAELRDEMMILRAVDAPGLKHLAKEGDSHPASSVYCQSILDGRLPRLMPDTGAERLARSMEITRKVPIGSHVGIPIRRHDGSVYGMFCCFSRAPIPTLNERDLEVAEMFADLVADQVDETLRRRERQAATAARLQSVLRERRLTPVYQPIFDLSDGRPTGFEALTRFSTHPGLSPASWFHDAETLGLTIEFDIAAIEAAIGALEHLPQPMHLSLNVSSKTILSRRLPAILDRWPSGRVVLEVTERTPIDDYDQVAQALVPLRSRGVRLAVDDSGAGAAGLQQIVRLQPDVVKIDCSLTSGIDTDLAKRALAAALVHFANETGAAVTAEGIETGEELATLRYLGVHKGQGWYLGHPADVDGAVALVKGGSAFG